MNLAKKLLMTTGTSSGTVPTPSGGYVDDVFSAYTYTGNGSTQTINNGIDLAGEGGLVWQKLRSGSPGSFVLNSNLLWDTIRGVSSGYLKTDTTQGAGGAFWLTSFNSNGFSFTDPYATAGANYVSWTFRKAPKFFDVVTYTGNDIAGRQIAHSLGVAPGMIIVKRVDSTSNWLVYHRGRGATEYGTLNGTDIFSTATTVWNDTAPSDSVFTIGTLNNVNGATYVSYLFAHDPEV